jgi:hypothetical protein
VGEGRGEGEKGKGGEAVSLRIFAIPNS